MSVNGERQSLSERLESLVESPADKDMRGRGSINAGRTAVSQKRMSGPSLRWLGNWSPIGTPKSPATAPPSPGIDSLNEALREPIQKPAQARLPDSFYPRPPPFMDSLTRTTLPTASLSPKNPVHAPTYNPLEQQYSPPILLSSSPRTRTSLDTLRTVSARDHNRNSSLDSPTRSDSSSANGWWWFQSENKGNIDVLLSKEDQQGTLKEEQDHFQRRYRSPRNPLVFCHGLLGFDSVSVGPSIAPLQVTHWRGIKEVLEANGAEVLITRVPATSTPVDRAKVLAERIDEVYPGRSVHLIGHSMGGLDCRYLTTHITQRKFKVLSVTTIASPHRGSSFADHFLTTVGRGNLPSVMSLLDLLPNGGGDGKAFEFLTRENMRKFNEETPDVDGVKYFSWGAMYEPGLIDTWKWPHSVVLEKEGPNDGLVSVASSKWGTYLGTLSDVNHLDLVGWINTARYKWAEMTGREIKFKPATFYLGIADMLAGEVDGVPAQNETSRDRNESPKPQSSDTTDNDHNEP